MAKQKIWTSILVEEARNKIADGWKLERINDPFYEGIIGLRRSGLTFKATQEEISEYIKCKLDIHHFAQKYCYVKGEDGKPFIIKLRDYQVDILDNLTNKRFNILMASRQSGKCSSFNTICKIQIGDIEVYERIGKLYYKILSEERSLTLVEKLKIKLYDFLYLLEDKNDYIYDNK